MQIHSCVSAFIVLKRLASQVVHAVYVLLQVAHFGPQTKAIQASEEGLF